MHLLPLHKQGRPMPTLDLRITYARWLFAAPCDAEENKGPQIKTQITL